MDAALRSLLKVLPSTPVEPPDIALVETSPTSGLARVFAPSAISASDVAVATAERSAPPGRPVVICTISAVRCPEDLSVAIPALLPLIRAIITSKPSLDGRSAPSVMARASEQLGVEIVVFVPADTPVDTTVSLASLVIAGTPVPLGAEPPSMVVFSGPRDLTAAQAALLQSWIGGSSHPGSWRELYRASRDGFKERDFHSRCDDKERILVLIRTEEEGWLFGGFTAVGFLSRMPKGEHYADPCAFLYSLNTPLGRPEKLASTGTGKDVVMHRNYGATFGNGCDLYVHDRPEASTCVKAFSAPSGTGKYPLAPGQQNGWSLSEVVAFAVPP